MMVTDKHPRKMKSPRFTHQCVRPAPFPSKDSTINATCWHLFKISQLPTGGYSTSQIVKHNKYIHDKITKGQQKSLAVVAHGVSMVAPPSPKDVSVFQSIGINLDALYRKQKIAYFVIYSSSAPPLSVVTCPWFRDMFGNQSTILHQDSLYA